MSIDNMRSPLFIYGGGILAVALFKLYLVSAIHIFAQTWAGHDDRLFVNLAYSIIQHQWLGDYNQYTLMKGPGFSLWLVCLYWLHIPLLLGNQLLFLTAAAVFSWAVKCITGSYRLAFFCYLMLAMNVDINNRAVRESLYTPLTLLIFALIILQFAYFKIRNKLSKGGVLLFGFLLCWFWIVREESIWILPSLLLCMWLFAFLIIKGKTNRTFKYKQILLLITPIIILLVGLNSVAAINGMIYRSWNVVELKSKEFTGAYGSLARVNPDRRRHFVPVTRAARNAIYKESPAYREISPFLDAEGFWQNGCPLHPTTCNEIAGGWFLWALREAVAKAGYYQSGVTASDYYRRLKTEIDAACQQKRLVCSNERNTLLPVISLEDIPFILHSYYLGMVETINPVIYRPSLLKFVWVQIGSQGDNAGIAPFNRVLYDAIAPIEFSEQHEIYKQQMQQKLQIRLLIALGALYGIFFQILLIVSFIYFIYQIKLILKRKSINFLWFINASIFIAIAVRLLILAIIDATSFSAINPLYLSPIYPIVLMFVLLNMVIFHQEIADRYNFSTTQRVLKLPQIHRL